MFKMSNKKHYIIPVNNFKVNNAEIKTKSGTRFWNVGFEHWFTTGVDHIFDGKTNTFLKVNEIIWYIHNTIWFKN